jgi:hypothetical protein
MGRVCLDCGRRTPQLKRNPLDSTRWIKSRTLPFYNVVVHAPCAPVQLPTGSKPRGFYAPCFVRADDPDNAVAKAIEFVRSNPKTRRIAATFDSPMPELAIDSVAQIPWFRYLRGKPGWVLYDESRPAPNDARAV